MELPLRGSYFVAVGARPTHLLMGHTVDHLSRLSVLLAIATVVGAEWLDRLNPVRA